MNLVGPYKNSREATNGIASHDSSVLIPEVEIVCRAQVRLVLCIKSKTGPVDTSARAYSLGSTTRISTCGVPLDEEELDRAPALVMCTFYRMSLNRTVSELNKTDLNVVANVV